MYGATAAEGQYIRFVEGVPNPRTLTWAVIAKQSNGKLGIVKWYAQWRQYAFAPIAPSVYNHTCLNEIADFCRSKTEEHRTRRRQ